MFGIKPIRTIGIIIILFLIFSATRINLPTSHTEHNVSDKTVLDFMETPIKERKVPSVQDAVKIMHYLFSEKVKDKSMRCRYKKAKKRYFLACTHGDSIKDNYWEIALKNKNIKLSASSSLNWYLVMI